MSTQGCSDQEEIKLALRKLRKRLRQIESLEKLTRPLTIEEIEKVGFYQISLFLYCDITDVLCSINY